MSKKVLVIDDDELVRKSLSSMLETPDVSVLQAANGKEGFETALKEKPALIITDVHMPEMDGLEMIEKLRADEWGKTVPIIVMTVDEATTSINKALEAGITVYLSKGNDPQTIADQVLNALD